MRPKVKNIRIGISITVDNKIIEQLNTTNKSRLLEKYIIDEMSKDVYFNEELKNKKIII